MWEKFDEMLSEERIISTREVHREIEERNDDLFQWAEENLEVFKIPTPEEGQFVTEIYKVPLFRDNFELKKILKGGIVADPFVIARAYVSEAHVITMEEMQENAAKIPNICEHFNISCLNLEQFMEKENWTF